MAKDSEINVKFSSAARARMLQTYVKREGKTLGELLEQGLTVPQMINDQTYAALGAIISRNEIPDALLIEAEANADKAEAARIAAAPIPAGL